MIKNSSATIHHQGFASCPKGLEDLLAQELRTFGGFDILPQKGGVDFKANPDSLFALFAHSRFAGRIYLEVAQGIVLQEKDVYEWGRTINWEDVLDAHHGFKIDVVFYQNQGRGVPFKSKIYVAQTLKDAIVDHFRDISGTRPTVDLKHPDAHFLFAVSSAEKEREYSVRLLLDMSGLPLSNRGLRVGPGEASLRENIAAALVAWSSWSPATETFCDYMCGSGTIALEALQMGLGIPPRYHLMKNAYERKISGQWAWERLPFFSNSLKHIGEKSLREVYHSTSSRLNRLNGQVPFRIYAGDHDDRSLGQLRDSLKRLGMPEAITIRSGDFLTQAPPPAPGVLVMNLPFGERVGADEDLEKFYFEVGEKMKNDFKGYRAYLLTSKPELRKVIHLKTSSRVPVWHGPFECRVLGYNLF